MKFFSATAKKQKDQYLVLRSKFLMISKEIFYQKRRSVSHLDNRLYLQSCWKDSVFPFRTLCNMFFEDTILLPRGRFCFELGILLKLNLE